MTAPARAPLRALIDAAQASGIPRGPATLWAALGAPAAYFVALRHRRPGAGYAWAIARRVPARADVVAIVDAGAIADFAWRTQPA